MKKTFFILIALTPFLLSLTCGKDNGECHTKIAFNNQSATNIYIQSCGLLTVDKLVSG